MGHSYSLKVSVVARPSFKPESALSLGVVIIIICLLLLLALHFVRRRGHLHRASHDQKVSVAHCRAVDRRMSASYKFSLPL